MINMTRWQRIIYGLGEALLVGGLAWGLYRAFVLRACPATVYNDVTLVVLGVVFAVAPLHPFSPALYLRAGLRGTPLGLLWWLAALAGLAYSMYVRLSVPVPPDHWWFAGLVPAGLYFWFAVETKRREAAPPVSGAAAPAAERSTEDTGEAPVPPAPVPPGEVRDG